MAKTGNRKQSGKRAETPPDLRAPYRLLVQSWVRSSDELAALREMVGKLNRHNDERTNGHGHRQVADALRVLAESLDEDLGSVERLEPHLLKAGLQLDTEAPAGVRTRRRGRGRPRDLLSHAVATLLQERFPGWDPTTPFPERNTKKLRGWLYEELVRGLFDAQEIDPSSTPRLKQVVSNLKRGATRRRLTP